MTHSTSRLELTWIGKEIRPRLEPRILIEEPGRSYPTPHRVTDDNKQTSCDNMLALFTTEVQP